MEWKQKVRQTLRKYKKEAYVCLYPSGDWAWGTTKKNLNRTLKLMNNLLKCIPDSVWPKKDEDKRVNIVDGNWRLSLRNTYGRRSADLRFAHNDHTAWVIEHSKKKGRFVDFDIGGS